jgi:hypothetical protein
MFKNIRFRRYTRAIKVVFFHIVLDEIILLLDKLIIEPMLIYGFRLHMRKGNHPLLYGIIFHASWFLLILGGLLLAM